MVHGLGGSLVNWAALAPLLTETCHVVAVDLIGFGLTQAGTHSPSVTSNQQMLQRFLGEVVVGPAILVGNSMGAMIAILQAVRHPEMVNGLVLVDSPMPGLWDARPDPLVAFGFGLYAVPPLGHAMLKARRRVRSPEQLAMDVLRLCFVDPKRVTQAVFAQHMEVARVRRGYPDVDTQFLAAARSVMGVLARRKYYLALMAAISVPVLLLHGEKDRVVPIGAARAVAAANPSWRFRVAPDAGHVPQLEVPEWTAGQILDWLASCDQDDSEATEATAPAGE
jgi:pimeloyl-ACP methyl ester carboxylesterase